MVDLQKPGSISLDDHDPHASRASDERDLGVESADFHPRKPHSHPLALRAASRFNGAADFHPRKHAWQVDTQQARIMASMGPRTSIRGNRRGDLLYDGLKRTCCASMGPRTSIRGNLWTSIGTTTSHPCFNGAADFHPRKRGRRRVRPCRYRRFNGAADFHPRKRSRRASGDPPSTRFNGAADFHPRKLRSHRPRR